MPEFYATYLFKNVKNSMVFSGKLQLRVIELNQIERAIIEDKQNDFGEEYLEKMNVLIDDMVEYIDVI